MSDKENKEKKLRPAQKIKMVSVDELLGVEGEESSLELNISEIQAFHDHPFKVLDDEKMDELVESIRANGVITPVLVRPVGVMGYEMVSGHRRMHAAERAGLKKIPAIIRDLTDDEATIIMVEANAQREEVLPSEKAFAYKMRFDAIKRQGSRRDLTSYQVGTRLRADEAVAKAVGESKNQIYRYIRLTELIPDLLNMVDVKKLPMATAVEISYINKEIQKYLYEYIKENGLIKSYHVASLRKFLEEMGDDAQNDNEDEEGISQDQMIVFLNGLVNGKPKNQSLKFSEKKLRRYFPEDYTVEDMEDVVIQLLEQWRDAREEEEHGL